MTSLREKRVLAADEVATLLGRQVALDARAAGWLTPCAVKPNAIRPRPFFTMDAVRAVEDRMAEGEYPTPKEGAR